MKKEKIHYVASTTFTLDANYVDLKVIGRGSYGVVCSAFSETLSKRVAIKKITPVAKHCSDTIHALREVILMRHMGKHVNIMALEDLIYRERSDEMYIVMDLLDSDLHRIIQSKQILTESHYKHFFHQLLCGVKYLHDNRIIHRDLKPGNLLVTKDCHLRITDFGLARERPTGKGDSPDDEIDEPMTEHVVTRWYRPPELMLCPNGLYSYTVDIWSCGCILAEMLGRNPLFPGKNFVHQLSLIFDVIGSPSDYQVRHVVNQEAVKFLKSQKLKLKVPFSTLYPSASEDACDLLDALLIFDADDRLSADEALKSRYLHGAGLIQSLEFPAVSPEFHFSFEKASSNRVQLKQMLAAEALSLRREREARFGNKIGHSNGHTKPTAKQPNTEPSPPVDSQKEVTQPKKKNSHQQSSVVSNNNDDLQSVASEQRKAAAGGQSNVRRGKEAEGPMGPNISRLTKPTASSSGRSASAPKMRPSSNTATATATVNAVNSRLSNPAATKPSSLAKQVSALPKENGSNNLDLTSNLEVLEKEKKNLVVGKEDHSYVILDKDLQPKYNNFSEKYADDHFVQSRLAISHAVERVLSADGAALDDGTPKRRTDGELLPSPGKKSIVDTYMSPTRLKQSSALQKPDKLFEKKYISNPANEIDSPSSFHKDGKGTAALRSRSRSRDSDMSSSDSDDSSEEGSPHYRTSSRSLLHEDDLSTVNNNHNHNHNHNSHLHYHRYQPQKQLIPTFSESKIVSNEREISEKITFSFAEAKSTEQTVNDINNINNSNKFDKDRDRKESPVKAALPVEGKEAAAKEVASTKKKITVPRSPKFSLMSWQRRNSDNVPTQKQDLEAKKANVPPSQLQYIQLNDKYYADILKDIGNSQVEEGNGHQRDSSKRPSLVPPDLKKRSNSAIRERKDNKDNNDDLSVVSGRSGEYRAARLGSGLGGGGGGGGRGGLNSQGSRIKSQKANNNATSTVDIKETNGKKRSDSVPRGRRFS